MLRKISNDESINLDLTGQDVVIDRRQSLNLQNIPLEYSQDEITQNEILVDIREDSMAVSRQSSQSQTAEERKRQLRAVFEKYKQPQKPKDVGLLDAFDSIFKKKQAVVEAPKEPMSKSQPPAIASIPKLTPLVVDDSLIIVQASQNLHDAIRNKSSEDSMHNTASMIQPVTRTLSKLIKDDSTLNNFSKIMPYQRNNSIMSMKQSGDLEELLKENIFNDVSKIEDRSILTASLQMKDSLKISTPLQKQKNQSDDQVQIRQSVEALNLKEIKLDQMDTAETKIQPIREPTREIKSPIRSPVMSVPPKAPENIQVKPVSPFQTIEANTLKPKQIKVPSPTCPPEPDTMTSPIRAITELQTPRDQSPTPITHQPIAVGQAAASLTNCQLLRQAHRLGSFSCNLRHPKINIVFPKHIQLTLKLIDEMQKVIEILQKTNQQLLQRESKQIELRKNFKPQIFLSGGWMMPLSINLDILKPGAQHQRRICDHIQVESYLTEVRKPLAEMEIMTNKISGFGQVQAKNYVTMRHHLFQVLQNLTKISQDLYVKALAVYVPQHYIIFYDYMKSAVFMPSTQKLRSIIEQRQAMLVLLRFMKEIYDPLGCSQVGDDITLKLEEDLKVLKRAFYRQKRHDSLVWMLN